MKNRTELTEKNKIDIIVLYSQINNQWTEMSRRLQIPESTIRSFMNRYLRNPTLNAPKGRPITITDDVREGIVGAVESQADTTLYEISKDFDVSKSSAKQILNDSGISCQRKIPVPPLTQTHKNARVAFCNRFKDIPYKYLPTIVFTDESSIQLTREKTICWRRRGEYPNGSLLEKAGKTKTLMVWGGISKFGFKTELIRIDQTENSEVYIKLLKDNKIIESIEKVFGRNFFWQQDNARPHTSLYSMSELNKMIPAILTWPAESPDLSPIENLWNYLKDKLKDIKFNNFDELFARLKQEWDSITPEMIHNFYSSFLARTIVCSRYNGDSLNTHKTEVKHEHDKYRTQLVFTTHPITNQIIVTEQPIK